MQIANCKVQKIHVRVTSCASFAGPGLLSWSQQHALDELHRRPRVNGPGWSTTDLWASAWSCCRPGRTSRDAALRPAGHSTRQGKWSRVRLANQADESALRPDRIANAHQALVAEGDQCRPGVMSCATGSAVASDEQVRAEGTQERTINYYFENTTFSRTCSQKD